MTPRLRKLGLLAHITCSVGWLGALAAFLVLGLAGLTSPDAELVRSSYRAMDMICRFVIVPLSLGSLTTGLVQARGTEWGLLRHTWVFVKFILTLVATIVLLVKVPLVDFAARRAAETATTSADLRAAGLQLVVHAAGGLLVLLVITALSVFKPWGRTRWGRRKQEAGREGSACTDHAPVGVTEKLEAPKALRETPESIQPKLLDQANETSASGLSLPFKVCLAVIGALVAGLIVLHLASGGFAHRGH